MNDRFRFRVWDNNKKEYLDKGYIHRKGYLVMPTMKNDYSLAEAEGDFVIEQCTGLKDKNGKLIYEGDIIRVEDNNCLIAWDNDNARYNVGGYGEIAYLNYNEIEVIGNIHENPELVEG